MAFLVHLADVLVGFLQRLPYGFYQALDGFFAVLQFAAGFGVQCFETGFRQLQEFTAAGPEHVAGE